MSFMQRYKACRKLHAPSYCLRACIQKQQQRPTTMQGILHAQTGCAYSNIHIGDAHFDTISLSKTKVFLAQDGTDLQTYVAEGHDCENFALRLQFMAHEYFFKEGLNAAFCEIWGPVLINGKTILHGFNGFVAPDMILRLIEPQTDWIYTVQEYLRGKPYLIIMR